MLQESEDKPSTRPFYRLIYDKPCSKKFDCLRQSQVNTSYAPSEKELLKIGEGICCEDCRTEECHLVKFYRDCCDPRKLTKLLFTTQISFTNIKTKKWQPPKCQWLVRKLPPWQSL